MECVGEIIEAYWRVKDKEASGDGTSSMSADTGEDKNQENKESITPSQAFATAASTLS